MAELGEHGDEGVAAAPRRTFGSAFVKAIAPRLLRGVLTAAVTCLPVAALAVAAREGFPPLVDSDQRAIALATDVTRANPGFRDALVVWQEIFQPWRVYLAATPAVIWVWWRGRRARATWGFATMMVGWNLGLDVKLLVQRARPILDEPVSAAPGFSFPSGHAFNTAMAVTTVIVMTWPLLSRRRAVAAPVVAAGALVVVLTALDRVFLGVHFPSDVVAGVLLALAITYSSWVGFRHRVPKGVVPMNRPSTYRPTVGEVLRDIVLRAALPAVVVWAIVVGIGLVIMGPLKELPQEEAVTDALASDRTWLWNSITDVSSTGNDTWWTIGSAVVFALILLVVTKRWWTAIVPLLAITLESSIFVIATHVVGRPRPEAAKLDQSPPTSSYPSGHTGAAFALYFSLLLLARQIDRAWLRTVITVTCLLIPTAVAFSRLYRGMHHFSDVIIGVLLGLWCGYTAVRCIRANSGSGRGYPTAPRTVSAA